MINGKGAYDLVYAIADRDTPARAQVVIKSDCTVFGPERITRNITHDDRCAEKRRGAAGALVRRNRHARTQCGDVAVRKIRSSQRKQSSVASAHDGAQASGRLPFDQNAELV